MLPRLVHRFRAVVRRSAMEREMQDEMQLHLERRTRQLIAGGMTLADAALVARREFGNVALLQDEARDARGARWVESTVADVRLALRNFARKPRSAAAIVLTLAFGIGGHAFELSMLRGFKSRPAPGVPRDLPLVRVRGMWRSADSPTWSPRRLSYPELRRVAELRAVFSTVVAWTSGDVVLDVAGAIDGATARVFFVTDDYFRAIGVRPTRGPGLPRSAADAPLVAVISDAMWRGAFAGGSVTDRTVTVNGTAVRVVGVAPPRFTGVTASVDRPVLWMPLPTRATILHSSGATAHALSSPDSTLFDAAGRLRPGASPLSATAAVRVVSSQAAAGMAPDTGRARAVYDADVVWLRGNTDIGRSDMVMITTVWGIVTTLLLLLVCANVGGLVVSAGVARRQEIAVRLSLGASRARVIRQLLTESAVLALVGGALALGIFWVVIDAVGKRFPEADWVRPDVPTAILTMCVALGAGFVFGLTPALSATRHSVADVLKGSPSGATRRSRLQQAFVVGQVAFTQPLLVLIAGMIMTVLAETRAKLKDPERVLRLTIHMQSIPGSDSELVVALDRLARRIGEIPGVTHVLPDAVPVRQATLSVAPEDRGGRTRASDLIAASVSAARPGYFELLGVPLVRGDERLPADTNAAVIVSSDLARELWGAADPLGRRLTQLAPAQRHRRDLVVTGVYDARYLDKGDKGERMYLLAPKLWHGAFLIRTASPGVDLPLDIRRVVRKALPSTPTESVVTLAQVEHMEMEEAANLGMGAVSVGALVLLLASAGLYGVVALAVGQRRREIGVRMALGARAPAVVWLFYRGGVKLTALGVAIGLPLSLIGARLLNQVTDARRLELADLSLVGGAVLGVVFVVASVATLIPSRRAAAVDPVTALRSD